MAHPPPGVPLTQPRLSQPPPGVQTPPSPHPLAPSTPPGPMHWTVVPPHAQTPHLQDQPIVGQTPSRDVNTFAALAATNDKEDNTQQPSVFPVLGALTGEELKHKQLQKHPKYKDIWDTSYANELGWLCQGIGKAPNNPDQQ